MATEVARDGKQEKMQIFVVPVLPKPVRRPTYPERIALEVSAGDTVASLRARLGELVEVPPSRQRLVFSGSNLPDDGEDGVTTLGDLDIGDSSTLQLVETRIEVLFRRGRGEQPTRCIYGLSSTDTVGTLKAKFRAEVDDGSIPPDRQRWSCQGGSHYHLGDDSQTLAECGIGYHSTVWVDWLPWSRTDAAKALKRVVVLHVFAGDTIRHVKELVEAAEGVPVAGQSAFDHKYMEELEDGRTMADLGIMHHLELYHPHMLTMEYRREAGAQKTTAERGRVPRVLFRGDVDTYRSWESPWTPLAPFYMLFVPRDSRVLHVNLHARDPLLP